MPEWVKTPTELIWSYIAPSEFPSFSFRVIGFILSSKDKKKYHFASKNQRQATGIF
jgi:hypothetical protein